MNVRVCVQKVCCNWRLLPFTTNSDSGGPISPELPQTSERTRSTKSSSHPSSWRRRPCHPWLQPALPETSCKERECEMRLACRMARTPACKWECRMGGQQVRGRPPQDNWSSVINKQTNKQTTLASDLYYSILQNPSVMFFLQSCGAKRLTGKKWPSVECVCGHVLGLELQRQLAHPGESWG